MTWIAGTSTDYIDLSNDIVTAVTGSSLQSVDSITDGGTGYTVGDILTLDDGTATIDAQIEVTSVSSGVIDGVRIYNAGSNYTAVPSDPVGVTGGTGGDDAEFNLTFASNGWTDERDLQYSGSDREVILNGEGDGGDEIFVGWRTFSSGPGNYYNWELNGFTGYDSGLDTDEQPGVSPGKFDGASGSFRSGAYLLLQNSSMDWYLRVTPYYIMLSVSVGGSMMHAFLGWADRYATESEYPYPLLISGMASTYNASAASSDLRSGLVDPWRSSGDGSFSGPMFLRSNDGTWYAISNADINGSSKSIDRDRVVIPCGEPDGSQSALVSEPRDRFSIEEESWDEFVNYDSGSGSPDSNMEPTPGTSDFYPRVPCTVVFSDPASQIMVELPDIFWVSAFGSPTNGDRFIDGSDAFRIFKNGNRTEAYAFLAVKET